MSNGRAQGCFPFLQKLPFDFLEALNVRPAGVLKDVFGFWKTTFSCIGSPERLTGVLKAGFIGKT